MPALPNPSNLVFPVSGVHSTRLQETAANRFDEAIISKYNETANEITGWQNVSKTLLC